MIEGALLFAECPINVSPRNFLESFEADLVELLFVNDIRERILVTEKFGLDNPCGSFQLRGFTNCFSRRLSVKVCETIKGVNKRRIFLFFLDRVNETELY